MHLILLLCFVSIAFSDTTWSSQTSTSLGTVGSYGAIGNGGGIINTYGANLNGGGPLICPPGYVNGGMEQYSIPSPDYVGSSGLGMCASSGPGLGGYAVGGPVIGDPGLPGLGIGGSPLGVPVIGGLGLSLGILPQVLPYLPPPPPPLLPPMNFGRAPSQLPIRAVGKRPSSKRPLQPKRNNNRKPHNPPPRKSKPVNNKNVARPRKHHTSRKH